MDYLELQAKDEVFEYGSTGDLFYIILDGVVEIQIPNQQRLGEFQNAGYQIQDVTAEIQKNEQIKNEKINAIQFRLNNKVKNQEKDDPIVEELKQDIETLKRENMRLEIQLAELHHLKFL